MLQARFLYNQNAKIIKQKQRNVQLLLLPATFYHDLGLSCFLSVTFADWSTQVMKKWRRLKPAESYRKTVTVESI